MIAGDFKQGRKRLEPHTKLAGIEFSGEGAITWSDGSGDE
jgi:hypothetical protein